MLMRSTKVVKCFCWDTEGAWISRIDSERSLFSAVSTPHRNLQRASMFVKRWYFAEVSGLVDSHLAMAVCSIVTKINLSIPNSISSKIHYLLYVALRFLAVLIPVTGLLQHLMSNIWCLFFGLVTSVMNTLNWTISLIHSILIFGDCFINCVSTKMKSNYFDCLGCPLCKEKA